MMRPDEGPRTTNGPTASLCGSRPNDEACWFASRSFGLVDSAAMAIFTAESTDAWTSPTCSGARFSQVPAGGKYVAWAATEDATSERVIDARTNHERAREGISMTPLGDAGTATIDCGLNRMGRKQYWRFTDPVTSSHSAACNPE